MNMRLALLLVVLAMPCAALSQEQAFTNRATELKERGAPEARTLATLPEATPVKVLARSGGWTRVEAAGQQPGYVRVFHLRFPVTAETSSSGGGFLSGLASAVSGRSRSQSATIATTGIRGLSPEDLKNASPDTQALRQMQSYRADRPSAERFAREGRLAAVSIDYQEGGR